MALITLAEYKSLTGVASGNTRDDDHITALLEAASRAIQSYVDRKFDVALFAGDRTYLYDGSGFLDIDDCTSVTSISVASQIPGGTATILDPSDYTAMPFRETTDDDPHYYVVFHSDATAPYSPQMGFKNNLDTIDPTVRPVVITITATWGWGSIPQDVKLAAAFTIEDMINKPENDDMRAEAISGYSRAWGATPTTDSLALPSRARDLLAAYQRPF